MVRINHQSFFAAMGKGSCNACCLVRIAYTFLGNEFLPMVDMVKWIGEGVDKGYIALDASDLENKRGRGGDNFYVKEPAKFLELITKKKWTYRFEGSDYVPKVNEYEMDFWVKNATDGKHGIGHFTTPDYDPIQYSQTVEKGYIYTKRICKVEA